MGRESRRSQYFQEIARTFLSLRGAPFVLSSKDQVTIAGWEARRIPLTVVLEGIRRAIDLYRQRNPHRKMPALSFCHREVLKAFEAYQERRVGRARIRISPEEKRKRARRAVERCLRSLPLEWSSLSPLLDEALRLLSKPVVSGEDLESLEERLDSLLLQKTTEEERERARRHFSAALSGQPPAVLEEAAARWLIQSLRQKLKIPHLPLYYY